MLTCTAFERVKETFFFVFVYGFIIYYLTERVYLKNVFRYFWRYHRF